MLLGGFTLLRDAEEIELPMSAQRLVALLALRERPLSRAYLAGVLWPDCTAERSLADLRTALWRANHCTVRVIATAGMRLCLCAEVQVDVRVLMALGAPPIARKGTWPPSWHGCLGLTSRWTSFLTGTTTGLSIIGRVCASYAFMHSSA
jgi:hypothetical protein